MISFRDATQLQALVERAVRAELARGLAEMMAAIGTARDEMAALCALAAAPAVVGQPAPLPALDAAPMPAVPQHADPAAVDWARIQREWQAGESYAVLAARYGLQAGTVQKRKVRGRWVREAGVRVKWMTGRKLRRIADADLPVLRALYEAGEARKTMQDRFGAGAGTIDWVAKREGWKRGTPTGPGGSRPARSPAFWRDLRLAYEAGARVTDLAEANDVSESGIYHRIEVDGWQRERAKPAAEHDAEARPMVATEPEPETLAPPVAPAPVLPPAASQVITTPAREPHWATIKAYYEAGKPVSAIMRQHGLSERQLLNRAAIGGWKRPPAAPAATVRAVDLDGFAARQAHAERLEEAVAPADECTVRDWAFVNCPAAHDLPWAKLMAQVNAARASLQLPPFKLVSR